MQTHKKRVMGIQVEKAMGYMYSTSEDCTFKITELNSQSVVTEIRPGNSPLQNLLYDKDAARLITSDAYGHLYIYSAVTVRLLSINSFQHPPEKMCGV